MRRLALLAAGVAAIFVAFAIWTFGRDSGVPEVELDHSRPRAQGGFFHIAFPEPSDLNPYTTVNLVGRKFVLKHTHDSLLDYDPATGELRPALAESFECLDGDRRARFKIRSDVRFADGAPLGIEDVLFTFELKRVKDLALGAVLDAMNTVQSVRATGPREIEVAFDPVIFSAFESFATGYVVGKKAFFVEEVARLAREERVESPAEGSAEFGRLLGKIGRPGPGTGPYQLARWRKGEHLYLTQNPNSWRRKSQPDAWNLAGFGVHFVRDPTARFIKLVNGELNVYSDPEAVTVYGERPDLKETHRVETYDHRNNGQLVIVWNHGREKLRDARVRRALTMLFDRERIASDMFPGTMQISRSWFRPGSRHDVAADAPLLPFDPKQARGLIRSAGLEKLDVEILYATSQSRHRLIMERALAAFREAEVVLRPRPMDWLAAAARVKDRDFDGILLHLSLPVQVDPYLRFHSKAPGNLMRYANRELDEILERARVELDVDKRDAYFQRFNRIFREDQPMTLLGHPLSSVILSRRFQNVKIGDYSGLTPESWWWRAK